MHCQSTLLAPEMAPLYQARIVVFVLCSIIISNAAADRVFNTSQGYRAQQFFGKDLRNASRFGGLQWVHGFTANDHVDIVAFGEMQPSTARTVNLTVILRNFSYCWHYRVDDAIPAGMGWVPLIHILYHTVEVHTGARIYDRAGVPWLAKQALSIEISTPNLTQCDLLSMQGYCT